VLDAPFSFRRRDALKLTLLVVLAMLALGIAIGVFTGFTKIVLGNLPGWLDSRHPGMLSVINISAFVLVGAYAVNKARASCSEFLAWRPVPALWFGLLLPITVGLGVVVSEIDNVILAVAPTPRWIVEYAGTLLSLAEYPYAATFAVVIMAPVTEELFFRGLILRRLMSGYPAWPAIWTSALLFMAFHLNPWQFPIALLAGLLLGWVYARTRSLLLCIAGRAYVNTLALFHRHLPFTIEGFNARPTPGVNGFQPWWLDLAGVAILGTEVYFLARVTPPLPPPPFRSEPPPFRSAPPPYPAKL
jgi:uncharacterized protein